MRLPSLIILLTAAATVGAQGRQPPDPVLRELLMRAVAEADSFSDRFEAEVWLTDMSGRLAPKVPDPAERLDILKRVHYEAARTELPPELVLAVIDVESNFDRYAVSRVGAQGLMQIMPFWLREIGRDNDNLFRIRTNLRMGCTILRYYLDMEKGDTRKALARYNGSIGRRSYSDTVLERLATRWFKY